MKKSWNDPKAAKPSFKTKSELAQQLGIHINTLRKKMNESGIPVKRGALSPAEVSEIFKKLGYPHED